MIYMRHFEKRLLCVRSRHLLQPFVYMGFEAGRLIWISPEIPPLFRPFLSPMRRRII